MSIESDFRTHIALALIRQIDDVQFVMDRALSVAAPDCTLVDALTLMLRNPTVFQDSRRRHAIFA